jgi:hypothetical protein
VRQVTHPQEQYLRAQAVRDGRANECNACSEIVYKGTTTCACATNVHISCPLGLAKKPIWDDVQ